MLRARRRLLACASVPGHGALMHVPAAACAAQSARPFWRGLHAAASAMRHAEAVQPAHSQSQLARPDPRLPYAAPPTGAASSVAGVSPSALATELPRPGTVALAAAPVPFRPHRPLPPRIQSLIDAQLIKLRRKEHPEWLEKQHVRKMTLHERKQLVSRWAIGMTTRCRSQCRPPSRSRSTHRIMRQRRGISARLDAPLPLLTSVFLLLVSLCSCASVTVAADGTVSEVRARASGSVPGSLQQSARIAAVHRPSTRVSGEHARTRAHCPLCCSSSLPLRSLLPVLTQSVPRSSIFCLLSVSSFASTPTLL